MPPLNKFQKSCVAIALSQVISQPLQAATITVDTTADTTGTNSATCTLRDAILAANTDALISGSSCTAGNGADTIKFNGLNNQTITLSASLPIVYSDITLNGPGQDTLAISGNNAHLIINNYGNLTINSLGMINGSGSIFSHTGATTTINDSKISGHNIGYSAILSVGVDTNTTINNSTVSDNTSYYGGIMAYQGNLTVNNSTISGNTGTSAGGINSINSTTTINNSTVSGNTADYSFRAAGGGINSNNSTTTISNSTVSGNTGGYYGGGINSVDSTTTISNSTVSGNTASYYGGGISATGSSVNITNSIISGNIAPSAREVDNYTGNTFVTQNNVFASSEQDSTTAFFGFTASVSDILAISDGNKPTALEKILTPLTNNGGPTHTHAIPIDSIARNAGDNTNCPTTDQRGESRTDGKCDIGAFEFIESSFFVVPLPNGKAVIFSL